MSRKLALLLVISLGVLASTTATVQAAKPDKAEKKAGKKAAEFAPAVVAPIEVPELEPTAFGTGTLLLLGGAASLAGRRLRKTA